MNALSLLVLITVIGGFFAALLWSLHPALLAVLLVVVLVGIAAGTVTRLAAPTR